MSTQDAVFSREAAPAAAAWLRHATLGESVALALLALAWLWFSYGYVEDDSFIHLEFARSVASGLGFAFAGTVTNGDTAPLWVLFITFIHAFHIEWVASAKIACAVGFVVAVSGACRLASDLPREQPAHGLLPLAVVCVTVLTPDFVQW